MKIGKNKVATFDYTLSSESGEILDSSKEAGSLPYMHGIGSLIRGLESAMEGRSPGDSFSVSVLPAEGYGEWDETLLDVVPRSAIDGIGNLEVGHRIQVKDHDGARTASVTKIEDDRVTLDGNHPMVGMTLNFDINIVDVRDATKEELEHGHLMGEDDCGCGCQDDSCD